jgi:hypothetical protein
MLSKGVSVANQLATKSSIAKTGAHRYNTGLFGRLAQLVRALR